MYVYIKYICIRIRIYACMCIYVCTNAEVSQDVSSFFLLDYTTTTALTKCNKTASHSVNTEFVSVHLYVCFCMLLVNTAVLLITCALRMYHSAHIVSILHTVLSHKSSV